MVLTFHVPTVIVQVDKKGCHPYGFLLALSTWRHSSSSWRPFISKDGKKLVRCCREAGLYFYVAGCLLANIYCMGTLTRYSWIHYTVCWLSCW